MQHVIPTSYGENNDLMNRPIQGIGGKVDKTYRMYDRSLP